jgi:hypothetical protein
MVAEREDEEVEEEPEETDEKDEEVDEEVERKDEDQSVESGSVGRPRSIPNLTNFADRASRLRGGRLRPMKTYKVNKTIREKTPKAKSITSQQALANATKKTIDQALVGTSGPIGVTSAKKPGSGSGHADGGSTRDSSRATSVSSRVGLRRSARRGLNAITVDVGTGSAVDAAAAPLIGQALTALTAGVEVEGVIGSVASLGMLNSVQVTA